MKQIEDLKIKLNEIKDQKDGKEINIAITMHATPDPDCIGSACGMKRIIKEIIPDAHINLIYFGEISHPQNKTMLNVLGINLQRVSEVDIPNGKDISNYFDAYICVDVTPDRSAIPSAEYLMVVDHHKADTKNAKIKDIVQVGSASTLVWSYLNYMGIELDKTIDEDCKLATSLLVGIKTDTADLVTDNVGDLDFEAYKSLIGSINQKYLSQIVNYPIPPYHFDLRKRLDQEGHAIVENGVFIGGIGYITPTKRDAIASIAEERARVEGTDTSFIIAIVGSFVEVSVRSSGLSLDVDKVCKSIFGKEYAGGKIGAGAAKIPMNSFSVEFDDEESQQEAWNFIKKLFFKRILKEMANHR